MTTNNPEEVSVPSIEVNNSNISFSEASNSNEILLYVDENNQNVQDLIQVALNQGNISTTPDGHPCISLQAINNNDSLLSVDTETNEVQQHLVPPVAVAVNSSSAAEELVENSTTAQQVASCNLSNLFQLANLTGSLPDDSKVSVSSSSTKEMVPMIGENIECQNQSIHNTEKESESETTDETLEKLLLNENTIDEECNNADAPVIESGPGELNVGDKFYSLEEVEEGLKLYEENNSVKLYKRDVRSLEALLKRSLKLQKLDHINEKLKYGQLLYCCSFGGKRKAQKMACVDESGLARYTDCKMFIRFAISDDGMKLVVNGKCENHCHDEVVSDQENLEPLYVSNMGNAEDLRLGAGFVDLDALYNAVHKYETDNHIHLWRRDGRTVEALARRAPGTAKKIMETNPGLRFAELRFCCSYGGRQISEEKKEKVKSHQQGCEMHIRFGISDDGSQLVVKSMSEDHNHEIDEDTVVKEALHPDLCSFVSKLVWSDLAITVDEVKRLLDLHVINVMFKDQPTPPRTRRQYFPTKKQVRYFMTKAKSALNISIDAYEKLEIHAGRLKAMHSDEKMIFNFRVKQPVLNEQENSEDGNQFVVDTGETDSQTIDQQSAHLLFCHQTPYQQRLLKRYGSQVILTEVINIHSKIPFPLYCLYVQTNVDYQLVGEFIVQLTDESMIGEGLATFKEWNPGWSPKFCMVDYSEEQIAAVENTFSGCFVLISDESREQSWNEWIDDDVNKVSEHKDEILSYLEAIAASFSEDTLNTAARELEESEVWKMSDRLRNWFQLQWLAQAKRWVAGYRPDDYLMTYHNERTLDDELKVFKSIKLISKASPLHEVIQYIVENIVPHSKRQYEVLNQESCKTQNELFYSSSNVPKYLSCHPGKLSKHIYERILLANSLKFIISLIHPGIFTVQETSLTDDTLHTVSFGDPASYPSCDCFDWVQYKLPCIHFCAVFISYEDWSWDMLCIPYRSNPLLNVDWSTISDEDECIPGMLVDRSTQHTHSSSMSKDEPVNIRLPEFRRSTETPQVLATQCRNLMQQLVKIQLGHQSRDNLSRLKSDLKDLVTLCSNSKTSYSNFPHNVKPYRKVKVNVPLGDPSLSVFQQYNVQPVTPKQIIDSSGRKFYTITKPEPLENNGDKQSERITSSALSLSEVTGNLPRTTVKINSDTLQSSLQNTIQSPRKRIINDLTYLNDDKRLKLDSDQDNIINDQHTNAEEFIAFATSSASVDEEVVSSSNNVEVEGNSPIPIVLVDSTTTFHQNGSDNDACNLMIASTVE